MRRKYWNLLLTGALSAWLLMGPTIYIPYSEGGKEGAIQFHAFTNGKSREIAAIKKPVAVGLSVSPDGLTILYTQVDREDNDLMLVESMR